MKKKADASQPEIEIERAGGVYVALTGLNYGDPEKRVEPGEEVDDLPAESIPWLLDQGHIRPEEK